MRKKTSTARRLHPRLRVLRNGDNSVNRCRSELCTTVASLLGTDTDDSLTYKTDRAVSSIDLAAAQIATNAIDFSASALDQSTAVQTKLTERKKMEQSVKADDSYVNVFISVDAGQSDAIKQMQEVAKAVSQLCVSHNRNSSSEKMSGDIRISGNLISATIPIAALDTIELNKTFSFVQPAEPLKLDVPIATAATKPNKNRYRGEKSHQYGEDIIIGIIDVGGFDFSHPDFLDENGDTRFIRIWDQGSDFRAHPEGFDYGAEFKAHHLNAAISTQEIGGLPANLLEPQSQSNSGSHGTHVASIAAGNTGICSRAKIAAVLVDIPTPTEDRERRQFTFSDSSRIVHAVDYLLALAKDKPISINISLGTNGGGHDGSSGVTRWMDNALQQPGRSICAAAGNAGQEQGVTDDDYGWIMGRIHSSGRIPSRGLDKELGWVVVGNGIHDLSENELEIWYSAQDRFIVELLPPGDSRWLRVEPQEFIENKRLNDGTVVSIYNELYHPANGVNAISLYLSPHLADGDVRGVRAGVWRVRLIGDEIRNGEFHCWIERDDPSEVGQIEGKRLMRFPSFFSTSSNVDSHSLSSLASGHATVAVANYDAATNKMNITSSQGPTRDNRTKPDIAAPGTNVVAAKGFSNNEEQWISMSGTSMASPHVAGVIGLMLNANPALNARQCMGILQRTSVPLPGMTYEWANDAGFGRIDANAAIAEAVEFTERTER